MFCFSVYFMQTLVVYFILQSTHTAIYAVCITMCTEKKVFLLLLMMETISIYYNRKMFIVHVLLTSRPGSPSFPCQRTIVATLVFLSFMNRLLLLFYLRLPGHATLVLEQLLQKCEKESLLID